MTEMRPMPYSSRTRVALAIARAIAAGRGDPDVTPIHIALGLLREGDNAAVAVLQHRGVPLHSLRRELELLLGPPLGRTQPEEVARPLLPGEQSVLEQARAWSRREGDEHIGPEHLLLAILAEREGSAAHTLAQHGMETATAIASMRAVIHKHPDTPPPATPPRAV
jgi:ATP-dependent Clp protease ATP-binding subunit ClpC